MLVAILRYEDVLVTPLAQNRYQVLKPIQINDTLMVPYGYITDGASIPRIFWSLIPPFQPKILPAVIAHDYLTDLAVQGKTTFKAADRYMLVQLLAYNNKIKSYAMYLGCRLYHLIRYQD